MPTPLGEGMNGAGPLRPDPNVPAPSRLGEGPPQSPADPPASADSMHRAGSASRPFVLATLRALRLDPGPNPVLPTRRPKASKTTGQQPVDKDPPLQG